jgi:hypothetical protein
MDIYSKITNTKGAELPFEEFTMHPHCLIVDWREAEEDILEAFLAATGEPRDEVDLRPDEASNVMIVAKGEEVIPIRKGKGVSSQHSMLLALQNLYGSSHAIRYLHDVEEGDTAYFMVESPETWQRLEQENPNIRWFFVPIEVVPDTFETPSDQLRAAARRYYSAK